MLRIRVGLAVLAVRGLRILGRPLRWRHLSRLRLFIRSVWRPLTVCGLIHVPRLLLGLLSVIVMSLLVRDDGNPPLAVPGSSPLRVDAAHGIP